MQTIKPVQGVERKADPLTDPGQGNLDRVVCSQIQDTQKSVLFMELNLYL